MSPTYSTISYSASMDWWITVIIGGAVASVLSVGLGFALIRAPGRWAKALFWPLQLTIWATATTYLLEVLEQEFDPITIEYSTELIRRLIVIGALFWFVVRYLHLTHSHLKREIDEGRSEMSLRQLDVLNKFSLVVILSGLIVIVVQVFEVSLTGLIALGGFGSLAIGFAGKDIFSNLFSGIMLYLTRPFRVGDTIESLDGKWKGVVEHISWYFTQVRASDQRLIYFPNGQFSNNAVVNESERKAFQLSQSIQLRPQDASLVEPVIADILNMLHNFSEIKKPTAYLSRWASALDGARPEITLSARVKSTDSKDFARLQQEVLLASNKLVAKRGGSIV